ncbi:MAG: hypothetical protein E5X15_28090 [Mesorhizobium sp.]|nr:MAG: hypothetical protein E5X15_28090 [Mesorhizobium sp.]
MTMISEADIPAIELSEREKAPGRPSQPVAADAETPRAPEPSFANTTVAEASAGENPSVGAPAFKGKAAPPGPNPSYQRIQQADGKVYYKKIN